MSDLQALQAMMDRLDGLEGTDFSTFAPEVEAKVVRSGEARLMGQLADLYRERRLWREAEKLLQRAIKLEPSVPELYAEFGLLEISREDLPKEECSAHAIELFQRAIRLEKLEGEPSPATHTLLGATYKRMGKTADAEAEFLVALEIDPEYEEALFNLALLLKQRDPGAAFLLAAKGRSYRPALCRSAPRARSPLSQEGQPGRRRISFPPSVGA
jgi:tetratricopeptide (TPR) repeat protein